jgi:glycogen debranching enzyme
VATYEAALRTIGCNVVPGSPPYLRAGGGYDDPWTRDASINAWLGVSLLDRRLAADTLLMVTEETGGGRVIAQDDQWWDQMIWAVAAHHHYLVTGDREFLRAAFDIAKATAVLRERHQLDPASGLFRGPGVMQDGISGYPTELGDPALADESFVLLHVRVLDVLCLSTNVVHVGAYDALAGMAAELGEDPAPFAARAAGLRAQIERTFWDADEQRYAYLVEPSTGVRHMHEEEFGVALAVLLGVAPPERAGRLLESAHRSPHGVVNLWPHFDGYDDTHPARHNAMCWPMVMGVWAWAVATTGRAALFGQDLDHLVGLLASSDGQYELYDPQTGEPHGGWQALRAWASEPDQTWSATALVATIVHGLLGLRPSTAGLVLQPCVPAGFGGLRLAGLPYREAIIDVSVEGEGSMVDEVIVDGRPLPVDAPVHVAADATGRVRVEVRMRAQEGGDAP